MAVIDFNVDPYYDDFEGAGGAKSKKFHRVLFRPGFPVQARELTQLQSVLQNQIERFGRHIFEEGSMVIPGDIAIDLEYDFIKVQSTFNAQNVESYRADFVNKIITGAETGVKARVIGTLAATSTTPLTLYVKYEDSGTDNNTKVFKIGETVTSLNADNTVAKNAQLTADQSTELSAALLTTGTSYSINDVERTDAGALLTAGASDTVGVGSAVQIQAGVYFINGFFVANDAQRVLLDNYHNAPSYRIGFDVTQQTITPEEDETLKDNAQGASNFAAPGAHRYKVVLTLVKKTLTETTDTSFVELARVQNGQIAKLVKKADYNYLQEEFARRTYDESGDYEVKPFRLDIRESLLSGNNRGVFTTLDGGRADKLALGIEPGKAYVQGYEIESQITKYLLADKPRTFNRVVDTPIQTNIGNYILVQNLTALPEIDDFEEIYIYDDFVGGSPAVIGSCNVRGFVLHDGDYQKALDEVIFKFGIFDIQMNDGKDFARDARAFGDSSTPASASFQCDIKPKFVTLTGSASVATTDPTVTGVGSRFQSQVREGDRLYINEIDVGEVASSGVTNNLELELTANGLADVTGGTIQRFSAEIIRPDQKILVFPTNYFRTRKIRGDSSADPDNVLSTTYTVRRRFVGSQYSINTANNGSVSFTAAGSEETFASTSNLQNFTLVITSAGGNGVGPTVRTAGDLLDITTANLSLSGSDRTLDITNLFSLTDRPCAEDDIVELIASVEVRGNDAVEKSKTLNLNSTKVISTQAEAQNTIIGLGKADGYALKSVKMSVDFNTAATSSDQDITNRYEFDNGQKDAFYDLATIKLKPGRPAPTGRLLITFDYFSHGAGDYFSVDSYDGVVDYEDIPTYQSPGNDGKSYDLRDCLDFRPRIDDSGVNFTSSGSSKGELPMIGTNVEADFSYYLGRIDKVVVNYDGDFIVVQGVPSTQPIPPLDLDKAMTLFEVTYLPYVLNTEEVVARKLNNRRYTMKDIGRLDKRIGNLEEITSLNLLEKATTDLLIPDVDGNPRLKNGFIVDNFSGHKIGNVAHPDYRVAVDMKRKVARPMAHTDIAKMVEVNTSDLQRTSQFYRRHKDGIITLDYSEQQYLNNPYATDSMEVNAYKVSAFTGEMILTPASDDWKDTTRRPDLVVVDDNNFDAIKFLSDEIGVEGTVWEAWQDNWFGEQIWTGWRNVGGQTTSGGWVGQNQQQVGTQQVGQVREGVETKLLNSTVDKAMGDRIVDLSMIPYMRSIPVMVQAQGMRPLTRVNAFFDTENVNAYIKAHDVLTVTSTNRTDFNFIDINSPGGALDSEPARYFGTFSGEDTSTAAPAQAFANGDVVSNQVHTAVSISAITQVGNVTTITVSSVNGISVGHQVYFENIGGAVELNQAQYEDKRFFVESVDTVANSFTILQTDYNFSPVSAITAYTSGGTVQRIQATAIVSYQYPDNAESADGLPVDIAIANRKGGFAIGDVLTGSVDNNLGVKNICTISALNGASAGTFDDMRTYKKYGDSIVTDQYGGVNLTFIIPNDDNLRFRTGDRTLRLIDNNSNTLDVGVTTTKAEKIFHATGINETREETILSLRQAEFVRDRVQEDREITRNITGSTRFQRIRRVPVFSGGGGGGGNGRGGGGWGHDPLAQTFVVSECDDGVMLTKIDLFFDTAGVRPIFVQLVNTKDGFPGQKILAQKIINPTDVKTSADASVATPIVFDSPVFLAQDTTYALLVKVDEPGCKIFFSELGGSNLGDNRNVSRNPLTGTMFLSQNGGTWTPHQTRDLKLTMYRAEFVNNVSTVSFKNLRNGFTELQTDPFETAPNTNKVRVTQRNHGFGENDTVVIDNVAPGYYGANSTTNGIPHTELNGEHIVKGPVTQDTYIIEVTSSNVVNGIANLSSDFVGGTNIQATRNLVGDVIQPSITNIRFGFTELTYDMNIADNAKTFTGLQPVPDNGNVYFDERKYVYSIHNQPSQGYSAQLQATMVSYNPFVSPMIDAERVSLCMIANRIDNLTEDLVNEAAFDDRTAVSANTNISFDTTNDTIETTDSATRDLFDTLDLGKYITVSGAANAGNNAKYQIIDYLNDGTTAKIYVDGNLTTEAASSAVTIVQHEKFIGDIAPTGATNASQYITRRFALENPSTAIKILYEMNRPAGVTVDVYYKALTDGQEKDWDSIVWTKSETELSDAPDEGEVYRERTHLVEGLSEFSAVAVKFVFKSGNTAYVPKIKNLRVIALAL
jgi:hypothetical protein